MERELKGILNLDVQKAFDKTLYSLVISVGKINETNSKLAQGSEQRFIERNKDTRNRTLCPTSMLENLYFS